MRIMSWNVRGIYEGEKRRVVREMVRSCQIDILCIQESRCERDGDSIMREIGGTRLTIGGLSSCGEVRRHNGFVELF